MNPTGWPAQALLRRALKLIRRTNDVNWALADQAVVSGSNFITGIITARTLGVEDFGQFSLAWLVVLFVGSIQHAAINAPMMSLGPKQSSEIVLSYYGAALAQHAAFTALIILITSIAVFIFNIIFPSWNLIDISFPLICVILACHTQEFLRRYLFTCRRGAASFSNDLIRYFGQIMLLIGLAWAGPDPMTSTAALWAIMLASLAATLHGVFLLPRFSLTWHILRETMAEHWHFSRWLTASAILQWASGQLFIVMAGAMLGPAVVGALRAVQNLLGVTHIIFNGLENVIPVQAARELMTGGVISLSRYLRRVTACLSIITVLLCAVLSIAPSFWLNLLYGSTFSDYGNLLRGFSISYVLIALSLPLRSGLRALGTTQPIFAAYVWSSIFSVITVIPLVHWNGTSGVISGIISTQLITTWILWRSWRTRQAAYAS